MSYFIGTLPNSLEYLTTLIYLDLFNNQISGSIPETLPSMTSLTDLWLTSNEMTIPTGTRPLLAARMPKCCIRF